MIYTPQREGGKLFSLPLVFSNPHNKLPTNIKNINALKRLIPLLIAALSLSSCLKEDTWCPVMYVSFEMKDEFLGGDYDTRVHNDVLLYIFKDDKLAFSRTIPYNEIAGGAEYAIDKTPEILGNIKLVAWAVKSDETHIGSNNSLTLHHPVRHPSYNMGDVYGDLFLNHEILDTIIEENYHIPHHHERYLGTLDPIEDELWERHSHHDIVMTPAPGRIIVNINDPGDFLNKGEGTPRVVVEGGMSKMELGEPRLGRVGRRGFGEPARVISEIVPVSGETRAEGDPITHTTEIIGVLPSDLSRNDNSLSVHIMRGNELVKTYTIDARETNKYTAIHSGDMIEFNIYDLQSAEFEITINGFDVKVVDEPL